jgi:RNA polymerase sigma factor (sigma-70 family)
MIRHMHAVAASQRAAHRRAEWVDYWQALEVRDELVLDNLTMVEKLATGILFQVRAAVVDRGELVAAGRLRMIVLAESFDGERGISFEGYARQAVRGAMWELVRRRNWKNSSHQSLDSVSANGEDLECAPQVADERQTPEELLESARKRALAGEAMLVLSERERYVVVLYYRDHDLGAIGKQLNIGASMASRVHRQALAKMREYFRLQGRRAA